jgi:uncharacterized protein YcnI
VIRRRRLTVLATFSLVIVGTVPAMAHVGVDKKSVPPNADAALRFSVPVEPEDHGRGRPDLAKRHNEKVTIEIPAGFTAKACGGKEGWSCQVNPAAGNAPHHVAFSRSGPPFEGVDSLTVDVRTAAEPGSYPFEVNQTYSDGDTAHWDGPPDSPSPAPVVKVG